MRAVFSIHDQPQVYVSWARRSSLVDLGLRGERKDSRLQRFAQSYLLCRDRYDASQRERQLRSQMVAQLCPGFESTQNKSAVGRLVLYGYRSECVLTSNSEGSLIYDTAEAMDMCQSTSSVLRKGSGSVCKRLRSLYAGFTRSHSREGMLLIKGLLFLR